MSTHPIGQQLLLGLAVVVMSACAHAQRQDGPFVRLDRGMGSVLLGAAPQHPLGELVEDGEDVCHQLPYSACGYRNGPLFYYFRDGSLVSKTFDFSGAAGVGPWGLTQGDTGQHIVSKLQSYVGGVDPIAIGNVLFYTFKCAPRQCRLDIRMLDGSINSIRLYYSDAI